MKELKQISVKTSEHDVLLTARKNPPCCIRRWNVSRRS